jgi:hypothetical protein
LSSCQEKSKGLTRITYQLGKDLAGLITGNEDLVKQLDTTNSVLVGHHQNASPESAINRERPSERIHTQQETKCSKQQPCHGLRFFCCQFSSAQHPPLIR